MNSFKVKNPIGQNKNGRGSYSFSQDNYDAKKCGSGRDLVRDIPQGNVTYDAARAKQAEVEGRIRQLEAILQNAEIISEVNSKEKKVRLGSTVEILDLSDNSTASYKIVGSVEANPFQGSISNECALGIALVGSKVNDVVTVKAESPYDVKVLKILND